MGNVGNVGIFFKCGQNFENVGNVGPLGTLPTQNSKTQTLASIIEVRQVQTSASSKPRLTSSEYNRRKAGACIILADMYFLKTHSLLASIIEGRQVYNLGRPILPQNSLTSSEYNRRKAGRYYNLGRPILSQNSLTSSEYNRRKAGI